MVWFYKKAFALVAVCLVVSVAVQYFCLTLSERTISLLPQGKSGTPWQPLVNTDSERGGGSSYQLHDATDTIDYEFVASKAVKYPYVVFALRFKADLDDPHHVVDLANYSSAVLRIKCNPNNILSFTAYVADHENAALQDMNSARIASSYFPCEKRLTTVTLDLKQLDVPDWWLAANNKPFSSKKYYLDKTLALALWNSAQSPTDTPSQVTLDSWVLKGRVWWILYLGEGCLVILWCWVVLWCIRQHASALTSQIKMQLQKDLPLVAYQQLFIEPHKDKEKSAVLQYIATEYSNPELSLEVAITALGINRNKINETLKTEIGLTFIGYLNKVRLTEAARLLAESREFNISEAAYSVGYSNVSYFNKLFKAEYGCTPKAFQAAAVEKSVQPILEN